MIKQLLNLVIAKYHDLSVSRRSIICLRLWQMIDLLFTDKSLYFTLPRSIIIIVNYSSPVDDKINFEIAHLINGSKIYPGEPLNNWGLCSLLLIKPLLIFKHHGGERWHAGRFLVSGCNTMTGQLKLLPDVWRSNHILTYLGFTLLLTITITVIIIL